MMAAYRELLAWQQRQNPPKTAPEVPDVDGSITHLPAGNASSINPSIGIRYDQAIILKQRQIERDHRRQLDALVARIEALESV